MDILTSLIFYVGKLRFGLSNLSEVTKWEAEAVTQTFLLKACSAETTVFDFMIWDLTLSGLIHA